MLSVALVLTQALASLGLPREVAPPAWLQASLCFGHGEAPAGGPVDGPAGAPKQHPCCLACQLPHSWVVADTLAITDPFAPLGFAAPSGAPPVDGRVRLAHDAWHSRAPPV